MKKKYKGQALAGYMLLGGGGLTGYLAYRKSIQPITYAYDRNGNIDFQKYADDVKERDATVKRLLFVTGGIGIVAITLCTLSEVNKEKYKKIKSKLALNVGPHGIGMRYCFN